MVEFPAVHIRVDSGFSRSPRIDGKDNRRLHPLSQYRRISSLDAPCLFARRARPLAPRRVLQLLYDNLRHLYYLYLPVCVLNKQPLYTPLLAFAFEN